MREHIILQNKGRIEVGVAEINKSLKPVADKYRFSVELTRKFNIFSERIPTQYQSPIGTQRLK